jgi:hypothetical protein
MIRFAQLTQRILRDKMVKCHTCGKDGHIRSNKKFHPDYSASNAKAPTPKFNKNAPPPKPKELSIPLLKSMDIEPSQTNAIRVSSDTYTEAVLREQYKLHKSYVKGRIESSKALGVKFRFPSIPEDISENIIKFAIHKAGDRTSSWSCKRGDLFSNKEGKQECKCFTSDGPPSFTPSSEWDVIYFLDAREWINDSFTLYKVNLKRSSEEWKNIRINKKQTFEQQCKQGRRPRITWDALYPQVSTFTQTVFQGSFDDLFTSLPAVME